MIRLCMRDLLPAMLKVLDLAPSGKKDSNGAANLKHLPNNKVKLASSGSNWKKLKVPVKSYLDDLLKVKLQLEKLILFLNKSINKNLIFLKLVSNINEADILNAMLRHMRLLINFYMCFPKMLKSLIKVWDLF